MSTSTSPDLPGLQEVDVTVPADLPALSTTALVCVLDATGTKACSVPAPITLTGPPPEQ